MSRIQRRVAAAAAISEHPLPTHAVGDAVGEVLDRLGTRPDLAAVFVTGNHAGALEDIARTVRAVLRPRTLVGAASTAVLGGHREVEQQPAVVVWAARCGRTVPVRIRTARMDDGWSVTGLPSIVADGERQLFVLADPFSFPADGVVERVSRTAPDLSVVGGLVAGALGPGGTRLVLDDEVHTSGAVGVVFERGADVAAVTSHGARAVGEPFVITRVDAHHVLELGGRPAVARLRELLEDLAPGERAVAASGLQIGIVLDESRSSFGRADFRIRPVVGADLASGAVSLGESLEVGQTVQFHLRDADAADADLRASLRGLAGDAALVVTSARRGHALFGYPDHDADVVSTSLDTRATAGVFCDAEIGPVQGRNQVHSGSTSVAVVGARPA